MPTYARRFRCLQLVIVLSTGCLSTDPEGIEAELEEDVGSTAQALYAAGWEDLGGSLVDLSISSQTSSRFDVWGIGAGSVWHKVVLNGFGSGWENGAGKPSGKTLTGVAAAWRGTADGCTDVVATDTAGKIWINTWCDRQFAWSGWTTVGAAAGVAVGKPALSTVVSTNRRDVWVRGTDNALWHTYKIGTAAWSAWFPDGTPSGGLASAPAVITRQEAPLIIEVIASGTNNRIWQRTWANNAWSSWQDRGPGAFFDGPTVAAKSVPSQLTFLGRGASDSTIYQKTWTSASGWSAFTTIAPPTGGITQGIEARYVNSKLEIVATGATGTTWRKSQEVDIPAAQAIVGAWGRCLDVDAVVRSPGNNPRATLSVCDGSPSQRWTQNGQTIRNVVSGQCLNVENGATANFKPVVTYPCSATPQPNERWQVAASGGTAPTLIKGVGSQRCLKVPDAPYNPPEDTGLMIYDCRGLPSDLWHLGNGTADRIRIKAFALQDDELGTNGTTLTLAQLRGHLLQINKLYLRAGIRFEIADTDWVVLTDPVLNHIEPPPPSPTPEQAAAWAVANPSARSLAGQYPGYLTLLLRSGGGGFAGPAGQPAANDYAVMSNANDARWVATLAHEMGHHFGLAHTHREGLYVDCADGVDCYNTAAWNVYVNGGLDGDGLADTPPDPGPWVYERRAGFAANPDILPGIDWQSCDPPESITIFNASDPRYLAEVTPDRRNVESYFMHCWVEDIGDMSITPQQLGIVRSTLFSPGRAHLLEVIK